MTEDAVNREGQDSEEYDPYEHLPDRIDTVTASGLEQLHDVLAPRNRAKLRSVLIEHQAILLWKLVEQGAISFCERCLQIHTP